MDRRAALRALLLDYVPSDAAEGAHRAAMLDLLDAPGDPFARDHFAPGHFTASAFVLDPAEDDLLLVHHRRLGRWLQPGGHIDPDDAGPLQAATREAAEETGAGPFASLGGIFDLDVHAIPGNRQEPDHRHFDVRFLLRANDRRIDPSTEVDGARWVAREAVARFTTDRSVHRAVAKLAGR
jgi:8-oxo-dGTP pyrophosphatase MutT (NUDIX family)